MSGNPSGRPPKGRALTEILENAGSKTVERDGKRVSGKQLVAALLWDIVKTGQCVLPNGTTYKVDGAGWFEVVKFIYTQVDGPAKQSVQVAGDANAPLIIRYVNDWRDNIAQPASGPDRGAETGKET